jgi:small-conductance mechanosensitive channel/CRP-like cAMP-binding protein
MPRANGVPSPSRVAPSPLTTPFKGDVALDAIGFGIAIVLLLAARLLLPREDRSRIRIAAVYLVLAVFFGLCTYIVDDAASIDKVLLFLYYFFLLASAGRSLVLLAVDVVIGRRTHRAPPRIFRDLTQAVVYVIVVLLTLRGVGVEPGSLLTTSALLTAVVGLALQDTLGNLVSGLALQMQRPFEVGDWIQFDQDQNHVGQVTEVNWRATTVITNDQIEVIVPNALLAKAAIKNFTKPTPISRRSVLVQAPYQTPPHRVQQAIEAGLVNTPGLVVDPTPWVRTKAFADSGVEYEVFYFTNDYGNRLRIDGIVRDRVWYALQRAGIQVPFPTRIVNMHHVSEESEKRSLDRELERRDRSLRCVDFLDVLSPEMHRALAAAATVRLFAPGEVIVREGENSTELYILDRGEVVVELGPKAIPIARLGPGKFFGEMALMTGEVRRATVRALTECETIVVSHAAFHDTLAAAPDVVEKMSDLLASRQAELEAAASSRVSVPEPMQQRSRRLVSQIKSFFKI